MTTSGDFLPSGKRGPHGGRRAVIGTDTQGLRADAAVTVAYWAFTLSDRALRLLVLLQFNGLGFKPILLAWLLLLYELAGAITYLYAGWIAARFGHATKLYAGLCLQIAALVALAQLDPMCSIPVLAA